MAKLHIKLKDFNIKEDDKERKLFNLMNGSPENRYTFDIAFLFYFFHKFLYNLNPKHLHDEAGNYIGVPDDPTRQEIYIGYLCAGLYKTDEDSLCFMSPKNLRTLQYYEDIDFKKLILRGYDMAAELEFNCEELFKKGLQINDYSQSQCLFENETKNSFLRKDKNPDYLKAHHKDYETVFKDCFKK